LVSLKRRSGEDAPANKSYYEDYSIIIIYIQLFFHLWHREEQEPGNIFKEKNYRKRRITGSSHSLIPIPIPYSGLETYHLTAFPCTAIVV
jgi:hypothetical protein